MLSSERLVITGGAGFIGTNLVSFLLSCDPPHITIIDRLSYAGSFDNFGQYSNNKNLTLVKGDIADRQLLNNVLQQQRPNAIINLAAETHVDRSIDNPRDFIQTNVVGTFELLEAARAYFSQLDSESRSSFRLLHVSTDEVFGSLDGGGASTEKTRYSPRSPYAASKAASDHFVHAYFHTFGLPVLTTNCSNNYGPFQYPEKLVPLALVRALAGESIPVYGDGLNIRDWLFVDDHCRAISTVLERGIPGESYNIGARVRLTNLQVVQTVCDTLDSLCPKSFSHRKLIVFVEDRPGHDRRYAIDPSKIEVELGWRPSIGFAEGILRTAMWYLGNRDFCRRIASSGYKQERLGLGGRP